MLLATQPKLGALLGTLLVLGACSPAPMPISQSSRDPSSPTAPEGVTPAVAPAPAPAATHSAAGHEHHSSAAGGDDAGAEIYVCPMHPEVTASAPGVCPKCNMKLVPKK